MTDDRDMNVEPAPDPLLHAALTDAFDAQPADTDWAAMSRSIRSAAIFRLRARSRVLPWWEQVGPLARKLVPVGALAAAASLALAMATPPTAVEDTVAAVASTDSRDPLADAVAAPNGGAVVSSVAGPVDDEWLWNATVLAHAAEGQ
jgi:hypothetical protein